MNKFSALLILGSFLFVTACCALPHNGGKFLNRFLKNLNERKHPKASTASIWRIIFTKQLRKKRQATLQCPTLREIFTTTNTSAGARSISPYVIETNISHKRIPEVIPVSTCRCSGCLIPNNPNSEEGDRENTAFSSVLVRVPVQIFDRHLNTTRNFTIDAGCICIKPSTEIVKK